LRIVRASPQAADQGLWIIMTEFLGIIIRSAAMATTDAAEAASPSTRATTSPFRQPFSWL